MTSIALLYFSGTGNTALVANQLAQQFASLGAKVDLLRVEDLLKAKTSFDPSPYDMLGFGAPVYCFGTPEIVLRFIKQLPEGQGKSTFIFRTAGDAVPINQCASLPMIRRLRHKGYNVFHERLFAISSNWANAYDARLVKALHDATVKKCARFTQEVLAGEQRFYKPGFWLRMALMPLIALVPTIFKLVGKDLKATDACVACGICVRDCPANNIDMVGGHIFFGNACNSCMRCIYNCPQQAIQYRIFKGFIIKGGYNLEKTLIQASALPDENTWQVPDGFKAYIEDDDL